MVVQVILIIQDRNPFIRKIKESYYIYLEKSIRRKEKKLIKELRRRAESQPKVIYDRPYDIKK